MSVEMKPDPVGDMAGCLTFFILLCLVPFGLAAVVCSWSYAFHLMGWK